MKRKLLLAACLVAGALGMNAQKDVTSQYITNSTLSQGYSTGWTATGFHAGPTQGHNTVGYTVECWAGDNNGSPARPSYSLTQDITLPKGSYRLVNYSFYRYSWSYDTDATKSEAYLKAGDKQVAIKTLGSIEGQASYANSMAEAANRFDTKMYRNFVEFDVDADNTVVNIGITGTHTAAGSWFICGMFELFDLNDVASVSSPTDMTYAITNPGFEYLNLHGWTNTPDNAYWYMDNGNWGNEHKGVGWVEKWAGSNFPDASLSQTLTGIDNGLYEVTVLAQARGGSGFYLYANDDKVAIGDRGDYSVRTNVTNNTLTIKVGTESFAGDWTPVDNFRLKFYGDPLKAYQDLLDAAVAEAQALIDGAAGSAISATAKAAWQTVVDDNDNDDNAFTEESQFNAAIENITNANTNYQAMASPYATWLKVKAGADAIAAVEYTETTAGSHSTFATAITTQTSAADNATTAAAITEATTALTAAIKTYIAGAEPKNDGEYFNITCLMVNPAFDNNSREGWSYTGDAPNVNWDNCEYYEHEFDINQTVNGLPTGSYSLSVQAFQRPGWAGAVYDAYIGGTDNASSVLYINSITSNVKNIAADAQTSPKLDKVEGRNYGDWPYDSQVGSEGAYKYVPNSQQGAKLYFEAGLYDATCAAVVTDENGGSLKLGFKSTKDHVSGDWTIFDNFRLYYYGSSLLVYYKQYLPQLKSEASADLSNALYNNVTGKERYDFQTALAATPAEETEAAYKAVIDDIAEKQAAFRAAVTAYDALAAAKAAGKFAKYETNVGTGVFQYNETTNNSLYATYEEAYNTMMSVSAVYPDNPYATASFIQPALNAYNNRLNNYKNQALNAPEASKHYNIVVSSTGNAIVLGRVAEYPVYSSSYITNSTGFTLKASSRPEEYLAQACVFTPVEGKTNTYYIYMEREEGAVYLTYGSLNDSQVNWKEAQIQATTDAAKKGEFKIVATSTENVFNIVNTITDVTIACQNEGNIYTEVGNADFTIAEASQATVSVTVNAGKFATRIFPFTPILPAGVVAYSCDSYENDVLELKEVTEPKANEPYLLYSATGVTATDLSGWGTAAEKSYVGGLLTGVYTTDAISEGSYVLQTQNGVQAFYQIEGSFEATEYRAYLTLPTSGESGVKARVLFVEKEDATLISVISALTSGEVDAIYTLDGAPLNGLQKGINIVKMRNGETKKVLVK